MKKILNIMAMIAVMVIIAGSSANGQMTINTCAKAVPPAKGCVGTCNAILWFAPGSQVPATALTFACEIVQGKCKCVVYMSGQQCKKQTNGKCGGSCPPLYLVPGGAAINGKCIEVGKDAAGEPICACRYVLN